MVALAAAWMLWPHFCSPRKAPTAPRLHRRLDDLHRARARAAAAAPAPADAAAARRCPMTDEAQKKVAAYRGLIGTSGDTPGGFCLGTGMPGSMLGSGGYPMEIVQRPEQINITYEAHNEVRRVYLGDRIVPMDDRVPGRNGHSSAQLGRRHAGASRPPTSSSRSTSATRTATRRRSSSATA